MKHVVLIAASLLLFGCSGRDATNASSSEEDVLGGNPEDVLVKVNGHALTRGEAAQQLQNRLAPIRSQVPPARLPQFRRRMLDMVVQQFIGKTLLLQQADKRGIEVTPEETEKAFKKIAATLPEGVTVEDAMQSSPLGEDRMRDELLTGLRIDKLLSELLPEEEVSDDEVSDFLKQHEELLRLPERLRARHILIRLPKDADAETRMAKKEKIDDIREQLLKGADFAELAKKYSEGPTARNGGDLGIFPRGKMVKSFDEAAFSQKVNEIGKVIETPYGYHIIQVLQRWDGGAAPKEDVIRLIKRQERRDALRELIEGLKKDADIEDYRKPDERPGESQ